MKLDPWFYGWLVGFGTGVCLTAIIVMVTT